MIPGFAPFSDVSIDIECDKGNHTCYQSDILTFTQATVKEWPREGFSLFADSRSIGAVAGLALAIFFTWRMLRSPSGSKPRQRKWLATMPGNFGVSAPSNAIVPSGVCSLSDNASAQKVVDEFFRPVKPTLGQIVRQKLSEGRKVCHGLEPYIEAAR